jgi:hypothetical protein
MNNMNQENKTNRRQNRRPFWTFTSGFLTGLAGGVILGILYAPDKGSETRKKIRVRINDTQQNLEKKMQSMKQTAEAEMEKAKQMRRNAEERAKEKLESITQNL